MRTLRDVEDFGALSDEILLAAVGAAANLLWPAGSVVYREGDEADAVYVVLRGRVRVEGGGSAADAGPGEHFGERSVLRGSPREATATAAEDCELMVIPKAAFEELLADADVGHGFREKAERRA